jgi:hypothetical protein
MILLAAIIFPKHKRTYFCLFIDSYPAPTGEGADSSENRLLYYGLTLHLRDWIAIHLDSKIKERGYEKQIH